MNDSIQIDQITAYSVKIPMVTPFRISAGVVTVKEFMIVEGRAGDLVGWGEATVDGIPFYTYETAETAMHISRRVLAPLIKSRAWSTPAELVDAMDAYRGHAFTKAAFECMFWDIYAKKKGQPVARLIQKDEPRPWIETGPSVGIKDSPEKLVEAVARELERGYRRIKIKVSPGKDRPYIEAVRKAYPDTPLMVDANSAYTPEDMDHLAGWDDYNLVMIEQPLEELDLYYHARLCQRMKTPICLDESIPTVHLARCALEMKAMDILNNKVGRVSGLVRTRQIHDLCLAAGVPMWIGARLSSGIYDALRLAAAALPNCKYPSDIGFSRPYLADDIVEGYFEIRNGCEFKVPTTPGIGIDVNRARLQKYTDYKETL